MNIVLVFGGRDFTDQQAVNVALDQLAVEVLKKCSEFAILHGGARGADSCAGAWARSRGVCEIRCDANWHMYGKSAGPHRNRWMLKFCHPGYAVGFPGGAGTDDMRRQLLAANITLWEPYK